MRDKTEAASYSKEVAWLVSHRSEDVEAIVRHYKRLVRGRRSEYGIAAALFVTALEAELMTRELKEFVVKRPKLKERLKKSKAKKATKR